MSTNLENANQNLKIDSKQTTSQTSLVFNIPLWTRFYRITSFRAIHVASLQSQGSQMFLIWFLTNEQLPVYSEWTTVKLGGNQSNLALNLQIFCEFWKYDWFGYILGTVRSLKVFTHHIPPLSPPHFQHSDVVSHTHVWLTVSHHNFNIFHPIITNPDSFPGILKHSTVIPLNFTKLQNHK